MSTVCGEIYQEMKVSPKIQKVESRKKKKRKKLYGLLFMGQNSKDWTELTLKRENLPCRIHS